MSIIILILSICITYYILDIIDPPITQEGYKIMPLKILLESIIISSIITVLFFVFFRRYLKKRIK